MLILIPHRAAETLRGAGPWGRLTLRIDRPEGRAVVAGISHRENSIIPVDPDLRSRLLGSYDSTPTGYWYRASAELHAIWIELRKRRNAATALDIFKTAVADGFRTPGPGGYLALTLALVDPDRLDWHNLVRHTSARQHIGRFKVDALAEELAALRPDTATTPLALNVITDADRVRAHLTDADLAVCTADGVAARRVTGHLARRAGLTAVLACVLNDGALGEIMRLRPRPGHGCLTCRRQHLIEAGGIDPEPALDAGYGTGTTHRPMTAVGPDLHLVAHLAAKTAVASILERAGHPDQRLPGEHALIALRRQPDWAPPFDLARTTELRWLPADPPRNGCPTCETP
ncbi:ThiF family adenylyltransferase [Streptomyces tubercidicus]